MSDLIAKSLRGNLGEAASIRLVHSIPHLELLQLQLYYIHHRSKQLGRNSMAFAEPQTRKIVDDFEHAIHAYVSKSASNRLMEIVATNTLRRKIKDLTVRSRWIHNSLEASKHDVIDEQLKDLFIGRDEDLEKLESALVGNMESSTVCILGVAAIGKTTLAKKLFYLLDYHFEHFAWLNVPSKNYDKESLLKDLLLQLDTESRNISYMHGDKVVRELYKLQTECQCCIVLDGVWCSNTWFNLVDDFPSKKDGSISKLLITTPSERVGEMVAEKSGVVHVLKAFSEDCQKFCRPGIHI